MTNRRRLNTSMRLFSEMMMLWLKRMVKYFRVRRYTKLYVGQDYGEYNESYMGEKRSWLFANQGCSVEAEKWECLLVGYGGRKRNRTDDHWHDLLLMRSPLHNYSHHIQWFNLFDPSQLLLHSPWSTTAFSITPFHSIPLSPPVIRSGKTT